MNKSYIKFIRDNIPESLFILTAPIVRNELIKNKIFSNYYKLLEKREGLSPDSIAQYQFQQLKQILEYSGNNVPFYNELFKKAGFDPHKFSDFDQIKKIPNITREFFYKNN
jgi:phenylacetate-coenzyme A ligase PaaK-like adenylate-forming protein